MRKDAAWRSFLMLCNSTTLDGLAALRCFQVLITIRLSSSPSREARELAKSRSSATHSFAQLPQRVVIYQVSVLMKTSQKRSLSLLYMCCSLSGPVLSPKIRQFPSDREIERCQGVRQDYKHACYLSPICSISGVLEFNSVTNVHTTCK